MNIPYTVFLKLPLWGGPIVKTLTVNVNFITAYEKEKITDRVKIRYENDWVSLAMTLQEFETKLREHSQILDLSA